MLGPPRHTHTHTHTHTHPTLKLLLLANSSVHPQPHGWIVLFLIFIYLSWLHWVLLAARGLSLLAAESAARGASPWAGFSHCGARAPGLQRPWCEGLAALWHLPRPGVKPVSPALAGRFPTTGPPGKFCVVFSLPALGTKCLGQPGCTPGQSRPSLQVDG